MYYVYCHTCLPNQKKYIGITKRKPQRRWQAGFSRPYGKSGYNPELKSDYNKFGKDNFKSEVLFIVETLEEANNLEKRLIAILRTYREGFGYNWTEGGDCWTPSEETKQRRRQTFEERWGGVGLASQEIRLKVDETNKERYGSVYPLANPEIRAKADATMIERHGAIRIMQTEAGKENYRQQLAANGNSRIVQNVETGEIFISLAAAAEWAGLTRGDHIGDCLRGKRYHSGRIPEGYPMAGKRASWYQITYEEYLEIKSSQENSIN